MEKSHHKASYNNKGDSKSNAGSRRKHLPRVSKRSSRRFAHWKRPSYVSGFSVLKKVVHVHWHETLFKVDGCSWVFYPFNSNFIWQKKHVVRDQFWVGHGRTDTVVSSVSPITIIIIIASNTISASEHWCWNQENQPPRV